MTHHHFALALVSALTISVPAIPITQSTPILATYHDVTNEWPDEIIAAEHMLQEFCYPKLDAHRGNDYAIIEKAYQFTLQTLRHNQQRSSMDPVLRGLVSGQGDSQSYYDMFSMILLHYGLSTCHLSCENDAFAHELLAVKLNEKWYICDPYLEDQTPSSERDYYYFLKGFNSISQTHGKIVNWDNCPLENEDYTQGNSSLSKAIPIYRIYNPRSGEHFYTQHFEEMITLSFKSNWILEGVGWNAPIHSDEPVYRIYNPNTGDHHFTTNRLEKDTLVCLGWVDEGIAWYSNPQKTIPLYRQYNANVNIGSHNYTTSIEERDALVQRGWHDEKIAWYGMPR